MGTADAQQEKVPDDLSSIPGTHTVGEKQSPELFPDLHIHIVAMHEHTCVHANKLISHFLNGQIKIVLKSFRGEERSSSGLLRTETWCSTRLSAVALPFPSSPFQLLS